MSPSPREPFVAPAAAGRAVWPTLRKPLPGLLLCGLLTACAYGLGRVPGPSVLGALGIALLLGIAWRATFGLPVSLRPGTTFAAGSLLRVGVVLLGVRLDFGLLVEAGPRVLLVDLAIVTIGIFVVERIGRSLGLDRGLRFALAVGCSICGASAVAAAAPVVGANDDEVSVSVGVVSLLGTLGVVVYTVAAPVLALTAHRYGLLTGSTLHEVAQVLAAGAARGPVALDVATLTKLTRVALLAPALLVIGTLLRRADERRTRHAGAADATRLTPAKRPPLLPGFLVGFLIVGVLHSLGAFPIVVADVMQAASLLLTAAAMAGIGLGVDLRVVRRLGGPAVTAAVLGLVVSIAIATVGTIGMLP